MSEPPISGDLVSESRYALSDCCLYRPGHKVHWIQVGQARSDEGHRPEEGRLMTVAADGLVVIEVDGKERRLWNHDPDRLATIVAEHGGRLFHQPRWGLLRCAISSGDSFACFCVTDYDDIDRIPCRPADSAECASGTTAFERQ